MRLMVSGVFSRVCWSFSIAAMTAKGLQVIKLDQKATSEFRAAATDLIKTMRGGMVPADVFDMALAERDAYRKSKGR